MNKESPFPPRPATRSPVPRPSLPQAGQSTHDRALDLIYNDFLVWVAMAATLAAVAISEWAMWALHVSWSRWLWTVIGAALVTYAIWKWRRLKPVLAALRQGMRGEREVGRMLEQCRSLGYEVFHDVPGEGFNVDHMLIGPAGVFAVETKTISKPGGRQAVVRYDGQRVLIDGMAPDRDPIAQARAAAGFIGHLLEGMTGRSVPVRAVVLFPGWWVERLPKDAAVWVLNPKAMRAFLANEPVRLGREEIALLVDRLMLHLYQDRQT